MTVLLTVYYLFQLSILHQDGNTSLHLACRTGALDILKYLIEAKADLEAQNNVRRRKFLYVPHHIV